MQKEATAVAPTNGVETPPQPIFEFGFPFHKCCSKDEMRPALNFIQFKGGCLYATEGHVVLKINLQDLNISEDAAQQLEGYYLHRLQFDKIWNKTLQFNSSGLIVNLDDRIEIPLTDSGAFLRECTMPFPDCDAVIHNMGTPHALPEIGFTGSIAKEFFTIFKDHKVKFQILVKKSDEYYLKGTFDLLPNSWAYIAGVIFSKPAE